jgi:hypothetical protein
MSKKMVLSDELFAALTRAAAPRCQTPEQFLDALLVRMTESAWLPVFDAHERPDDWARIGESLSVLRALARERGQSLADLLETLAAAAPPRPYYESIDDFARHLGASDDEIEESRRLVHELFPPDPDDDPDSAENPPGGAAGPDVVANADA